MFGTKNHWLESRLCFRSLPDASRFLGISYVSVLLFILKKELKYWRKRHSEREVPGVNAIKRRAVSELFSKPHNIDVLVNIVIGEMKFCSLAFPTQRNSDKSSYSNKSSKDLFFSVFWISIICTPHNNSKPRLPDEAGKVCLEANQKGMRAWLSHFYC